MLPALLAAETRDQVVSFLETTFAFRDPELWSVFEAFLRHESDGLFKGPYLSIELPYRKASAEANAAIPLSVRPTFTPYQHQCDAWMRLASRAQIPRHTLVTTGTSSGKTECFLYPVLDHCARQVGIPGIKAIILYPMNALATDQARRVAEIIHEEPTLRGKVRAGMYVGGQEHGSGRSSMSATELITDRDALRDHPPDILLTNYKMLDLLLLRPEDKALWQDNRPETLRYVVIDELHTFDGAQGADVACLLRRLRSRLGITGEDLTCVGTSATIASGDGDPQTGRALLATFASRIFAADIQADAIVGETRLSFAEYQTICEDQGEASNLPLPAGADCLPRTDESHTVYLARLGTLWCGEAVLRQGRIDPEALGKALLGHDVLPLLLRRACGAIRGLDEVAAALTKDLDLPGEETEAREEGHKLLLGFLALLAEARWRALPGERLQPLLAKTQVQVWLRELRRLGRELTATPTFRWLLDETQHLTPKALPPWYCRECGTSGWLAQARDGDRFLNYDRSTIYDGYFANSKHSVYLTTPRVTTGQQQLAAVSLAGDRICPACTWFGHHTEVKEGPCPACGHALLTLDIHRAKLRATTTKDVDAKTCPCCAESGHLAIVGSQSASLASIVLGHLYTHPLNTSPKVLAFTDSVQDASHRAGFFQARTYRVGVRTAVARVIADQGPLPLFGLGRTVLDWWIDRFDEQEDDPIGYLIAHLTPPDLTDLPAYREALPTTAPITTRNAFLTVLARRLDWEFTVEFGLQSRRGRTLEKAAAVHVRIDDHLIDQMVSAIAREAEARFPRPTPFTSAQWRTWVSGILEEARRGGSIDHPYLEAYAKDAGTNTYALHKGGFAKYSHEFAPGRGLPRLMVNQANAKTQIPLGVLGYQQTTWFMDWSRRVLSSVLDDQELHDYGQLFAQTAIATGMCLDFDAKGSSKVYTLRPEILRIYPLGELVRCSQCNAHLTVAAAADVTGSPCRTKACTGTMQAVGRGEVERSRFYRDRYLTGTVRRIVAHEHTGLLERKEREQVEDSFKGENDFKGRADNLNLLTCTSTMEMGINIGDLSSTMLCSVPPTTASYLQRIGRAGRGTGSALILSMATSRSHDLHFFADPHAMMNGAVQTPGIFLEAPEVLARHYVAFVIDTLVAESAITVDGWPVQLRKAHEQWERNEGPLKLIVTRLEAESAAWQQRFRNAFPEAATDEVWKRLATLVSPQAVANLLLRVMNRFQSERERIEKRLHLLRKERDEIKKASKATDESEQQLDEVEQLIKAQSSRRTHHDSRHTWSVLVDQGVLPNYAFPEAGVTLNAQVYFPKAWNRAVENHEWVRSAGEALRDLAPQNHFYANRRRFDIQRVELGDPAETVNAWRFCSACRYLEEYRHDASAACPECNASDWQDLGRLRNLHRLTNVASTMRHYESQSGDDSDDRKQAHYRIEDFFTIDHTRHEWAMADASLPFGFELLGSVTLRQVNLGLKSAFGSDAPIAGLPMPEQGFQICADCGLTPAPNRPPQARDHSYWCAGRVREEAGDAKGFTWVGVDAQQERRPYLYRELRSEALRLLLPTGAVESEEESSSFQAAFGLGLRLHFGGDPGHLLIRSQPHPLKDGQGSRTYLLIFDEVPGGTGYLREIGNPDTLRKILQRSLDAILACTCRTQLAEPTTDDADHDANPAGCYRCLLSYALSHNRDHIRRETAVNLLTKILVAWPKLSECPNHSLGDVPDTSLMESALERRFVVALRDAVTKAKGTWRTDVIGGKPGFGFTLADRSWRVIPQVSLGPTQGVLVPSKPDFIIEPVVARPGILPVAVFLDGYAFHVHLEDGSSNFAADLRKRRAIRASQRYLVWSLSWHDLDAIDLGADDMHDVWDTKTWNGTARQFSTKSGTMAPLPQFFLGAFDQMVAYLKLPHVVDWQRSLTRYLGFRCLAPQFATPSTEAHRVLTTWTTTDHAKLPKPGHDAEGNWRMRLSQLGPHLQLCVGVDNDGLLSDLTNEDPLLVAKRLHIIVRLDDRQVLRSDADAFTLPWRRFLSIDNMLQFLPQVLAITEESREAIPAEATSSQATKVDPVASSWLTVRGHAMAAVHSIIDALASSSLKVPDVGYELMNDKDVVVGQAELAWPRAHPPVAIIDPLAHEDRNAFSEAGWIVIPWDDDDAIATLRKHLKSET